MAGLAGGIVGSNLIFRDHDTVTEWADIYENEADEESLHYMLNQGYDVREAPRLYARLQAAAAHDPRIGLGFIAKDTRMKARTAHIQTVLSGDFKTAWEAKLKAGGLTGSSGEFSLIMAALKRDNGIIAIDYDLFAMARDNLEEAVNLRSNDPRAQLYLGKVISLTARTPEDRQQAEEHFMKAIQYDGARGAYPDPHLEHALHLIGENGDKVEIKNEIEAYVALYQREHMGSLPNNMAILYDYLTLVGDTNWYAAPAAVVSTKNVDAIRINSSGGGGALTGPQVISSVLVADDRGSNGATRQRYAVHTDSGEDSNPRRRRQAGNETSGTCGWASFSCGHGFGDGAADCDRHRSGLRCRRRRLRRGGGAASDAIHLPGPGGQQAVRAFATEPRGRIHAAGYKLADGVCAGPSGSRSAAGVDAEADG